MANDDITRTALIAMLKAGQITQAEAARLAGRSRQSVAEWIPDVDTTAARNEYLRRRLALRITRLSARHD
jgi:hypothetical protein